MGRLNPRAIPASPSGLEHRTPCSTPRSPILGNRPAQSPASEQRATNLATPLQHFVPPTILESSYSVPPTNVDVEFTTPRKLDTTSGAMTPGDSMFGPLDSEMHPSVPTTQPMAERPRASPALRLPCGSPDGQQDSDRKCPEDTLSAAAARAVQRAVRWAA